MKRASLSLFVMAFAALLMSFNSSAQRHRPRPPLPPTGPVIPLPQLEILSERVQQNLGPHEVMRLSQLLRVSPHEAREMEVVSLTIEAQSFQGNTNLTINSFGRPLSAPVTIRRQLQQVVITLPAQAALEGLELVSNREAFIESVTAQVSRSHLPQPGPSPLPLPNQLLTLQVNRHIRGHGQIPLKQLVRQQLGVALEGMEIERIVIEAQTLSHYAASVQVELNNRLVGRPQMLSSVQGRKPIRMESTERVRGNLRLHVQGDVIIHSIMIRLRQGQGQGPIGQPQVQRINVFQQISAGRPLQLGILLPYETRLVSAISLEAHSQQHQSQVALLSLRGEMLGSVIVGQFPMRHLRIQLMRPMSLRELSLQSLAPVMIESLEIELDQFSFDRF